MADFSPDVLYSNDNSPLSPPIQDLIRQYRESFLTKPRGEIATIHVDEIASKVAFLYERIRKIIDWKEDNLLRRSAIERILKRNLIGEVSKFKPIFKADEATLGERLVLELVRGGHLPNNQIPEEKINEVQTALKKYIYFLKNIPLVTSFVNKKKINLFDWILEVAACEIEEIVSPATKENLLIETMTALMNERIRVMPELALSDEEKLTQTYIAVHRTLFDLDDSLITYRLLKRRYPQWTNPSETFISETAVNIFSLWESLEKELNHPLSKDFFDICDKTDTIFILLGDILDHFKDEPDQLEAALASEERLKALLSRFYQKRRQTLKSRLFKIAIFSSLSVLISNCFSYFIVEVPLALLLYDRFSLIATIVDFILPATAMFLLVAIIKPPSATNFKKVVELTFNFVYSSREKNIYEIKPKKKTSLWTTFWIALFYLIGGTVFFGLVAWGFYKAKIPVASVILDTVVIAINVFAALLVRNKAKEITIEEKTTFWEFILDTISIPVAQVGSWLARKWKEYNVAAAFFNAAIEMPVITIIGFIEDWRTFLREKKGSLH